MPTLEFKGKQFVYTHHLSVPFRTLEVDAAKSLPRDGTPSLDDNLIIHGDNLHALKALLPTYAGKIDCIFIDPPYNTGNEGWCYSDRVNAPLIKEWLKKEANPVDKEDMERHDKWLCMMYPRIKLLHDLLSENGSLWMTLDDNEMHSAKLMLDEIFGEKNFLNTVIWEKADSPRMDVEFFSSRHDYILSYAKNIEDVTFNRLQSDDVPEHYNQTDEAGRSYYLKPLRAMGGQGETREARPNLYYGIEAPDKTMIFPKLQDNSDGAWRWSRTKVEQESERIEWRRGSSGWTPYFRIYADKLTGRPPETIFFNSEVGSSRTSKSQIKEIFPEGVPFDTPKPTGLLEHIIKIATESGSLILDSFAGSGTTAHSVLTINKDGGNRKFILVEMEDYADQVTAERVRRVINGVPTAKDEALKKGLGGSFTYCTLGEEINIASLLKGESVPSYEALARYVFYTATGKTLGDLPKLRPDWFIGETGLYTVHLIYQPDREFLRGQDAALNAEMVDIIAGGKGRKAAKKALVFAAVKFMGQKELTERNIEFCQLPYAIHRILGD